MSECAPAHEFFNGEDVTESLSRVCANSGPHRHADSMRAYNLDNDAIAALIEHMRRIVQLIDDSDMDDDDDDGKMAMISVTSMMVGIDMERDRQRKA